MHSICLQHTLNNTCDDKFKDELKCACKHTLKIQQACTNVSNE